MRHVAVAAAAAGPRTDFSTTLGIYGHQDLRDLERAMEAFARVHDENEP
jgi:hypothetical protein